MLGSGGEVEQLIVELVFACCVDATEYAAKQIAIAGDGYAGNQQPTMGAADGAVAHHQSLARYARDQPAAHQLIHRLTHRQAAYCQLDRILYLGGETCSYICLIMLQPPHLYESNNLYFTL